MFVRTCTLHQLKDGHSRTARRAIRELQQQLFDAESLVQLRRVPDIQLALVEAAAGEEEEEEEEEDSSYSNQTVRYLWKESAYTFHLAASLEGNQKSSDNASQVYQLWAPALDSFKMCQIRGPAVRMECQVCRY